MEIYDINKFVVVYPQGIGPPSAQVTCESCSLVYLVEVSWRNAVAFDKAGCPVVGYSFGRGTMEEKDVEEYEKLTTKEFNERLKQFLNAVESEKNNR